MADCRNAGRESVLLKDDCVDLSDRQAFRLLLLSVVEAYGSLVRIRFVPPDLKVINALLLNATCSQPDLLALWCLERQRGCWWRLYVLVVEGQVRQRRFVTNDDVVG